MTIAEPNNSIHALDHVAQLCGPDMELVNEHIRKSLHSDVILINQVAHYIITGGGKRMRPMLLILAARACGYQGSDHIPLASIIEFIHTATLLHDDVVDESDVRRGRETAHAVWGNAASVLVGDFLYSRSFQLMVGVQSMRVMEIMADATNTIAEGEVLQLLNLGDPEITEQAYYQVIENKTAKLFEAACRLAAVISGCDKTTEGKLADFGRSLGLAFQIADDVLDYIGDGAQMGKNAGDDLAEGKPTLPLIHARMMVNEQDRQAIDAAISKEADAPLEHVMKLVKTSGALDSAMAAAKSKADEAEQALAGLPSNSWADALRALARYSCNRNH